MKNVEINDIGSMADIMVQIRVVLGKTSLSLAQLMQVQEGSIIELNKNIDDEVDIYIGEDLFAKGMLVTSDGYLGVVLTKILDIEKI